MTDKKTPPKNASKATSDCYDGCLQTYDKCMLYARTDKEKEACDTAYTKCINSCPA